MNTEIYRPNSTMECFQTAPAGILQQNILATLEQFNPNEFQTFLSSFTEEYFSSDPAQHLQKNILMAFTQSHAGVLQGSHTKKG